MEQLESVDAEIQSHICISLLSNRLILESIVSIALAFENFPLVNVLVARGSPPPENETGALWAWRDKPIFPDPTVTALLRHCWLRIEDHHYRWIGEMSDEAVIDRFEAL